MLTFWKRADEHKAPALIWWHKPLLHQAHSTQGACLGVPWGGGWGWHTQLKKVKLIVVVSQEFKSVFLHFGHIIEFITYYE